MEETYINNVAKMQRPIDNVFPSIVLKISINFKSKFPYSKIHFITIYYNYMLL